jgi:hypothetical protein
MIKAHSHVGNVATALQLVDSSPVNVYVHDGKIIARYRNEEHHFDSEFELLLWVYEQIKSSAQESITWFENHREAFKSHEEDFKNGEQMKE